MVPISCVAHGLQGSWMCPGGGGGGIGHPPPSGERSPRLTEAILYLEPGYTK